MTYSNPTIQTIRESFEAEGYQLLSTEYKGVDHNYDFICPQGHTHYISWTSWTLGNRCLLCAGLNKTIEDVRKSFEAEGYTLLTKEYKGVDHKYDFICPKGNKSRIDLKNWNSKNKNN